MKYEKILDIFFPPKCGICEKIGSFLCDDCKERIEKYKINIVQKEKLNINNKKINVTKFYGYIYHDIIRNLFIKYKFSDSSFLANTFSKIIINNENMYRFLKSYDIIIPVPLHKKRKLERGYNQVELIAKKIEKNYLKIETNCLIKVKNIRPQSEKGYKERQKDIKGVYKLKNKDKIMGKKILLFDDICTTGSTVNECIKVLSDVTNEIGVLVIAKDYMEVNNG